MYTERLCSSQDISNKLSTELINHIYNERIIVHFSARLYTYDSKRYYPSYCWEISEKLKLGCALTGYTIAMVTCNFKKNKFFKPLIVEHLF